MVGEIKESFLPLSWLAGLVAILSILSGTTSGGNLANAGITIVIVMFALLIVLKSNLVNLSLVIIVILSMATVIAERHIAYLSPAIIASLFFIVKSSSEVNIQRANKTYFFVGIALYACVVVLALSLGFHNYRFSIWRGTDLVSRLSIGFLHPNVALVRWYGLMVSFVLIKLKKKPD